MKDELRGPTKKNRKKTSSRSIKTTLYDLLDAINREIKDDQRVRQIVVQLVESGRIRASHTINQKLVCA